MVTSSSRRSRRNWKKLLCKPRLFTTTPPIPRGISLKKPFGHCWQTCTFGLMTTTSASPTVTRLSTPPPTHCNWRLPQPTTRMYLAQATPRKASLNCNSTQIPQTMLSMRCTIPQVVETLTIICHRWNSASTTPSSTETATTDSTMHCMAVLQPQPFLLRNMWHIARKAALLQ